VGQDDHSENENRGRISTSMVAVSKDGNSVGLTSNSSSYFTLHE